jgi:hypothetical protein
MLSREFATQLGVKRFSGTMPRNAELEAFRNAAGRSATEVEDFEDAHFVEIKACAF